MNLFPAFFPLRRVKWLGESRYLQVLCKSCSDKKRKESSEISSPKLEKFEEFSESILLDEISFYDDGENTTMTKDQWEQTERRIEETRKKAKQFVLDNPQFEPIYERLIKTFEGPFP